MTEPIEEAVEEVFHPDPIPVIVAGDERPPRVETVDARTASWQTYVLAGTEAPFRLIPQDKHRHKATILVTSAGPVVYVGGYKQMSNAANAAAQLGNGASVQYTAEEEVWCVPAGAASVTVIDERY